MPYRTAAAAAAFLAVLVCSAAPAPAADDDSPDAIRQAFDAKQYKDVITRAAKAMSAKGADRFALLMLKGDASVQLKAKSSAADAYKQAAKETAADHDGHLRAAALATLLHEAAGNLTYVPRTGTPKGEKPDPLDVTTDDGRKGAFAALEADLLAKAKPQIEAAKRSSNLPQIMTAAKGLGDIRPVEFMVDGGDGDVNGLLGDLGNRVCKLLDDDMEHTVASLNADIEYLNAHINKEQISALRPSIDALGRDAKNGDGELVQVRDVSKQMPTVFGTVTDFKPTEERAGKLEKQLAGIRHDLREAHIPGWQY